MSVTVVFLLAVAGWTVHVVCFRLPRIPRPADPRAQWNLPVIAVESPRGDRLAVEVVRTAAERETGLMYRDVVPPMTGMLFVYAGEGYQTIWMRNTRVDLDLVFLNKDKKITCIYENVHHDETTTLDQEPDKRIGIGQYVLELAAGETGRMDLKKGQQLKFNLPGEYSW